MKKKKLIRETRDLIGWILQNIHWLVPEPWPANADAFHLGSKARQTKQMNAIPG